MENDFDQKAVSSQAAPPPPAPSVQLAQAHGERPCDALDSDDDRGFVQEPCGRVPEEGKAAGVADGRSEAFGRRRRAEKSAGGRGRSVVSDRRALVVAAGVFCLALIVAVAAFFMAPQTDADESRSSDRATEADSERNSAVVLDANATVDAREVNELVTGQFEALSKNENSELTFYVQAFMEDYDEGVDESVSYGFSDLGITADELAEKLCNDLGAEVVSVDAYGDKAWVEVSVTSRSFSDQAEVFAAAVARSNQDFADEESYKEYLRKTLLESFDGLEPRTNDTLIVVERVDGAWQLSSENMASLLGMAWYG